MHLTCTWSQALFPAEGFKVLNEKPLPLLWDCHHGDTFVLMVKGLQVEPLSGEATAEPITLEMGKLFREAQAEFTLSEAHVA